MPRAPKTTTPTPAIMECQESFCFVDGDTERTVLAGERFYPDDAAVRAHPQRFFDPNGPTSARPMPEGPGPMGGWRSPPRDERQPNPWPG